MSMSGNAVARYARSAATALMLGLATLLAFTTPAQAQTADGDLDKIKRVVKLGGFVSATPDFTDHPKVINGASDLMAEVFGEAGKHARFAVGAPSLPRGVAVEVDGFFELG